MTRSREVMAVPTLYQWLHTRWKLLQTYLRLFQGPRLQLQWNRPRFHQRQPPVHPLLCVPLHLEWTATRSPQLGTATQLRVANVWSGIPRIHAWSKSSASSTSSSGGSRAAARPRAGRFASTSSPMQVERAGPSPADVGRATVFARLVTKLAGRWSDLHPSCSRPLSRKLHILGVEQYVKVRGDASCWAASASPADLAASLGAVLRAPAPQHEERIRMYR